MTVQASCHCGAVKFKLNIQPEWLIKCNCSICSKLGTLWAHTLEKDAEITMPESATLAYKRKDASLAFHTCKTCGCTTHWWSVKRGEDERMALNMALLDPKILAQYRIRHFDGADSWKFTD
ncbi:MAG: GFA family protein [Alphaproteobacteria bacterium]|nr:GFA family protein [Alphaproteobacteria bacterium]